jgi:hypothetical protein
MSHKPIVCVSPAASAVCLLQLLPSKRSNHVKALMQQLAAWATDDGSSSSSEAAQQQQQQLSRVQQLMQLPLDCNEEGALLGWFRQRMDAGQTGGHIVPLYLLQVRSAAVLFEQVMVIFV